MLTAYKPGVLIKQGSPPPLSRASPVPPREHD